MSDNSLVNGWAWIDGEYVLIDDARIPILDTGFTRSDVTYDVVAVWKGKFFRLEDHLNRFENSLTRLRMKPTLSREQMREILFECVRRSGLRNAFVEMIHSRGIATPSVRDPRLLENRFYAYAVPYVWIFKPTDQDVGTHLVICKETIRIPPGAVDPTIKSFHWGDLIRGLFEAYDRGGEAAVLVDVNGQVTEGPGYNIFAYYEGALHTPASGVLQGITRRTVLELAQEHDIPTKVDSFDVNLLRTASEIFLSSTAGGIMPVTTLDGKKVGHGKVAEVTSLLRKRYWEAHEEDRWTTPVDYPSET
jgi:branched-chain amino acid aminotransferase